MKSPRILLLETDWILAANLQNYLKKAGYQIDWYADPQSAVSGADHSSPDLVILDLILAGRSGIEFLYEFRSYPDWQSLPVIVYSRVSKKELGESTATLEQLDIADYLYKPYTSMAQLTESVKTVLQPVHV